MEFVVLAGEGPLYAGPSRRRAWRAYRDYVERCLAVLVRAEDQVLVSGAARFFEGSEVVARGADVNLLDEDPVLRVREFFAQVRDNVSIYGLMRREALAAALPMRNCLAGDWLLVGRLAMAGKLRTLSETFVNRGAGGTSESYDRTVSRMGLTARERRHPHLAIASLVYRDVAHDSPAYAALTASERRALGRSCAAAVLRARPLNIVEDLLRPYLHHGPLRWLDRLARPVARRVQR
jgi:hypothetical protein